MNATKVKFSKFQSQNLKFHFFSLNKIETILKGT